VPYASHRRSERRKEESGLRMSKMILEIEATVELN
jgi:hypothetical protein